jgi:hypothetical protein
MPISGQTKKEFKEVINEELDSSYNQADSDEILEGLTEYFSLLHHIDQRISKSELNDGETNSKTDQKEDKTKSA